MAGKVFLNYRRDDSMEMAGRLRDRLAHAFGREHLFIGVDLISGGVFKVEQNDQVAACQAFVTVISPNWLELNDESGQRLSIIRKTRLRSKSRRRLAAIFVSSLF